MSAFNEASHVVANASAVIVRIHLGVYLMKSFDFIYCLYLFWNHLERIKLFELEVINFFIFVGGNFSALISLLPKGNEIFTALSLRRL